MATTIMLPDGKVETVFDLADMLRLIEDRMGWEARELLEEWIRPDSDAEEYIAYLEKEVEAKGSPPGRDEGAAQAVRDHH